MLLLKQPSSLASGSPLARYLALPAQWIHARRSGTFRGENACRQLRVAGVRSRQRAPAQACGADLTGKGVYLDGIAPTV